ncbi:MAG: hypothetical protein MMC33_005405 [Icmadophila ericetorum]|nr:hypothetical protein [Icmadophila ericetorum]
MARKLQDRLALASYKTKHGMDRMSFSVVEAHIESLKQQKRPGSSVVSSSDSSSTVSDHQYITGGLDSSPMTGPFFSDDIYGSDNFSGQRKRTRFETSSFPDLPSSSHSRKPIRPYSMGPPNSQSTRQTWKSTHNLADSSPLQNRLHPDFRTAHGPNISFMSETPTIPDSPRGFGGGPPSDDEEHELPVHKYRSTTANNSTNRGSPPRTPPPTRNRANGRFRKTNATGEEGADLLLYLATSPSMAEPSSRHNSRIYPPSTPPSHAALPSSMMATPGGTNMFGFNTPGQQFNFADFVNVTPSPAQGAFGGSRTPGLAPKTPLAAREARRRLNFDNLVPPSPNGGGSSNMTSGVGRGSTSTGLGMELGGELVS